MFSRMFCGLCWAAIFASHAVADIVVKDGDQPIGIKASEDVFIYGGTASVQLTGPYTLTIEGGTVGGIDLCDGADLTLSGGNLLTNSAGVNYIESHDYEPPSEETDQTVVTVRARYLRVKNSGLPAARNSWRMEGWLADGSWLSAIYLHNGNTLRAIVNIEIVPGGPNLPGDTDGDADVDVTDLNAVRNNFGGDGLGDADADGIVGIEDLNLVRNNFGSPSPFQHLGTEYTVTESGAVPEPGALTLLGVLLAITVIHRTLGR